MADYSFKFSIIMAIHDSVNYLKQAVDSIITQDLDFKENIQLILIDDGSSDGSDEICLVYQKEYPENVIFLSLPHLGVADARNLGLNHASGQYISFLDSDDYLSNNALSEVLEFFNQNHEKCDVASIRVVNFERENSEDIFNFKFAETKTVNLVENPNNPQLDFSSCFIKSSAIDSKFDCDLICSEDILLLYRILINNPFLGCINAPTYFKRRPYNLSSKLDTIQFKKEYYSDRLEKFHLRLIEISKGSYGLVPKFIQYMLCYDLNGVVSQNDFFMCDSQEEKQALFDRLRDILANIDDEIILEVMDEDSLKYFLYNIKYDGLNIDFESYDAIAKSNGKSIDTFRNPEIIFTGVFLKNSNLKLYGYFNDYLNEKKFSVEALKKSDKKTERFVGQFINDPHLRDKTYSNLYDDFKYFEIDIQITEDEVDIDFKALYHENGDTSFYRDDNLLVFAPKIDFSNLDGTLVGAYSMSFSEGKIHLKKRFDYLFAVVMAVYNTESYLRQSIDSVLNQTIGFKKYVQLILVDDGSEDSSAEILKEYEESYPDNIITISQENQGQAYARNNGFEHVRAKYVNFLDSDDYFESNALEEAYDFFERHYEETDVVSMPIVFFEKEEGNHMLNEKYLASSRVINLVNEPNNPQLHSNSSIFKSDVFGKYKFATNIVSSEDAVVINKILLEKKTLGVINSANYYYRKRYDESSTLDNVSAMKEFFIDKLRDYYLHLFDYALRMEGFIPSFLQYTLAYDLQWVLKEDLDLLNRQEQSEFWFYLNEVLSYIDEEMILNNQFIRNEYTRDFFLSIKRQDLHSETSKVIKTDGGGNDFEQEIVLLKSGDIVLADLSIHRFWLDIVDLRDDCLIISGSFNSYFNMDYISIEAVKYLDTVSFDKFGAKYVKYTKRPHISYLSTPFQYIINFDLKIPIGKDEYSKVKIQINYHKDGDNTNFKQGNVLSFNLGLSFTNYVKMSLSSFYKANDSHIVNLKHNTFYISPSSTKAVKALEKENIAYLENESVNEECSRLNDYNEIISLRKEYLSKYPNFSFMTRNKEIYLFQDRIDVADDNAYHLFKYACSIHDNVEKYFVVSRKSKQFIELSKIGNVVEYGSFKHKLLMLFADKLITTHPYDTVINPFFGVTDQRPLISGLLNYKLYWLQHGVTKDNISNWMFKFQKDLSLIVTVSDEESKSFLEEGYGYDESIIQNLGFPRFDNLKKNDNNQILIIPTWRKNITSSKGIFKSSTYFSNLNSFLNSSKLLAMIKKGYKIAFKPHPELLKFIKKDDEITEERFIDLFDIPDGIHVAMDESYQDLLNNSSVLITDYSSVFFDFAYLKKPIIYYHPENDPYHYEGTYFNYETMGFGDVVKTADDLFVKLDEYLDNNCQMEEEYQKRVDKFFTYADQNNCKRVYDWILKN
ncbi:CDP-glycerol:glycerophosphate glycerophosphotransferase [Methanobrevibacter sp.]|uniref:CDP-glycerol:glycerophosphate glycerophosphotransferase n=1 Tax=Methanobrevibacter sp. TaxID=66852 RepID=UPI003890217C